MALEFGLVDYYVVYPDQWLTTVDGRSPSKPSEIYKTL